jgi:hypothetical protein
MLKRPRQISILQQDLPSLAKLCCYLSATHEDLPNFKLCEYAYLCNGSSLQDCMGIFKQAVIDRQTTDQGFLVQNTISYAAKYNMHIFLSAIHQI